MSVPKLRKLCRRTAVGDQEPTYTYKANDHHQRCEPAAEGDGTVTDINGWLASAACCHWALLSSLDPMASKCEPMIFCGQSELSTGSKQSCSEPLVSSAVQATGHLAAPRSLR